MFRSDSNLVLVMLPIAPGNVTNRVLVTLPIAFGNVTKSRLAHFPGQLHCQSSSGNITEGVVDANLVTSPKALHNCIFL